jgi:ABC-type lipoprotein release transport system permease subunit
MEFTIKTLIVAILILIIVAILVAIASGWGGGAKELIDNFIKWIGSLTGQPAAQPPLSIPT